LEPVGDLGEMVGYRLETRGSMWHSGASGAGQLIADRVGEIIAQRELKHARVRLEIERCDADSVSPHVQPLALALPHGRGRRETPPPRSHHSRAAATAGRHPAFAGGRHRRERCLQWTFASPSAASYAPT